LKRVVGSMTHSTSCARSRAASSRHCGGSSTTHSEARARHGRLEVRVDAPGGPELRIQVAHELVAVDVEVDPVRGTAPLAATERVAVEAARFREVAYLQSHVEGRESHRFCPCAE
jgi:hypothetical protein